VQEAHDLAAVAHAATLAARVPFIHFFDGFRTSHEINKIEQLTDDDLRALIDDDLVRAHRARALSPDHPFIRGTAQNPDVYFQARETVNPYYLACPEIVQSAMNTLAGLTGRQYHLFEYAGAPDAERVIVIMGSGAETARATARYLSERGAKVGVVTVHLYRPFSVQHFIQALPPTVRSIAVLDRTKEPGSAGEPLYLDVVAALAEGRVQGFASYEGFPRVIGGRYGLSSKEFTPAMVQGIYDELGKTEPKNHFTIGITDDVTHTSLTYDPAFSIEEDETVRCVFWGLGSDGTVGANKNSIKIIGEGTNNYAQGYFVYDSKKSGSVTTSHLRFGPHPIQAPYLIDQANFVACHQFSFLERLDMPWTILRFGRLTDATGTGRIETAPRRGVPLTLSRDDAALAVVEALERAHLARQVVHVVDGERHIADALDAIEPLPPPPVRPTGLGAGQTSNPPPDPDMLAPDVSPLDADVEFEGDGPLPPELVGNEDPAPGIP